MKWVRDVNQQLGRYVLEVQSNRTVERDAKENGIELLLGKLTNNSVPVALSFSIIGLIVRNIPTSIQMIEA